MNLKKFKKSLVSIVLGSSLFLVNGGICQQPKAWFPDKFINSEIEKYENFPEMIKIINVLKFFSDLHEKPEYTDALHIIYLESLSYEKKLAESGTAETPEQRCTKWFAKAMVAATDSKSVIGFELCRPDGKLLPITREQLFGVLCLNAIQSDKPVPEILEPELELIFSGQQINDQNVMIPLRVAKPESSCSFYNSHIDDQLENLLNSAIKLLSK